MADCKHDIEYSTCSICAGSEQFRPGRAGGAHGGVASAHFDVGVVLLDCPYNEEFVAELKAALPYHARSWDREDRVWRISSEYWDAAVDVVEDYFDLVT